jgi:CSLREA domain-containing protein
VIVLAVVCGGFGAVAVSPVWGVIGPPPPPPTTVVVNTTGDEGTPGDGTCSLREAIEFAQQLNGTNDDCGSSARGVIRIVLPAGHYLLSPSAGQTPDYGLSIDRGAVVIQGAGASTTSIDAGGHFGVLEVGQGAVVSISGVTVTGGLTPTSAGNGSAPDGAPGGGIDNAGTLSLTDDVISGNSTGAGGNGQDGNLLCEPFPPARCDEWVEGNGGPGGSGGDGGGIFNDDGATLVLTGTTVSGNSTGNAGPGGSSAIQGVAESFPVVAGNGGPGGDGGNGGGIWNAGTLTMASSTISDNQTGAGGMGGQGGQAFNSTPQNGLVFTDGNGGTGGDGGNGGGIYNIGALTLGNSTIVDNLSALNSTIADNTAGAPGVGGATPSLQPSPAGAGGQGGGIYNSGPATVQLGFGQAQVPGASATLTNLTIAGNVAHAGFAAVNSGIDNAGGSLGERNTIDDDACEGTIGDLSHNLADFGTGCPGLAGNPNLGPLQNNGGPTETMAVGVDSAAIDRIQATGTLCPPTDQRGDPRPDDSETTCDIGAYEVQDFHLVLCLTCRNLIAGPTPGPNSFRLRLHGTEPKGATITTDLRNARTLVLLVREYATRHRLILIGYARLGKHPGGRSQFHWNLRVGGKLLSGGTYQLILYGLDGNVLSLPAAPGARTLVVLADGRVRT